MPSIQELVHNENELQELVSVKLELADPSQKQGSILSTPDDDLCLSHQDDDHQHHDQQHQVAFQRPVAEGLMTNGNNDIMLERY